VRILHIDPDDIERPDSGGGPIRTFEIYSRLSSRHEVCVLTPTFDGAKEEIVRNGILYRRLGKKIGDHGTTPHLTFYALLPFYLARYQKNFDLIVEDFSPPFGPTYLPLFYRRPFIASVQWASAKELGEQLRLPLVFFERALIKFYRNFIVLTEGMRNRLGERIRDARILYNPNGISPENFQSYKAIIEGEYILFLGRIDIIQKGLDILLDAFSKICGKSDISLVIAGGDMQFEEFRKLVMEKRLEKRVKLVGKVSGKTKFSLLANCLFLVLPSRAETFGMVATEAFAAGKTAIAFDIENLREIARPEHAVLVKPFDAGLFAQGMLYLLNNPEIRQELGRKALRFAQKFNWDEIAEAQEKFYEKIIMIS